MFKHILCPFDGSEASTQALDLAARVAADQQARLTICMVVDPSKAAAMAYGDPGMSAACFDALDDEATGIVNDALERVKNTIVSDGVVLNGQPTDSIIQFAASNCCDLIVMGSHGRTGLSRAFVGSVAEGVLRHANVPVMIVRFTGRAAVTLTPAAATVDSRDRSILPL